MIILFEIPEQFFVEDNRAIIERMVHEITDIYLKGSHLVVINRSSISAIRNIVDVGGSSKIVLEELFSSYTQTRNFALDAPVSLRVADINSDMSRKDGIYFIGLRKFIEYKLFNKAKMLVENALNDGDFISVALERIATKARLGRLCYEVAHGGGADMPELFKAEIEARRITVCLADSDKKCPGSPDSDKCKKIRRTVARGTSGIYAFAELPCHEAENLIPLSSLRELTLSVEERAVLQTLEKIEAAEEQLGIPLGERFKVFFDFKKGFEPQTLKLKKYETLKEFLQEKFVLGGLDAEKSVIGGLGDKVTKRLMADGRAVSDFAQRMLTCPYWIEIFSPALMRIAHYLIGCPKRPAM